MGERAIHRQAGVAGVAVVPGSANVKAGHTAVFTIDNLPIGIYRVTRATAWRTTH